MKLINLKMNYFGPFESEEIDFSSLNNKLFLISGRTGSGKTMIFDAIVYALYGSASTTGRDEESLRSQFAPENRQAEVKLTFEVRGKQYTVERTLKYHKPGNKSATPPKAVLYSADGEILASKLNEVKDAVEDVVKLTRAQFRKILILPQGEFKDLLVSSSTDKQDILRTLFQTGRFLNFELNLKEQLKERSKEADALDLKINERIKYIHTEDIDITKQEEFPNYSLILEYSDGIIFSYEKKLEELTEQGQKLNNELAHKQEALEKKQKHNEQVEIYGKLQKDHSQLAQRTSEVDAFRQAVNQFDKVSQIKYELLRFKDLDNSLVELDETLAKEKVRKEEVEVELKSQGSQLEDKEKDIPAMNKRQQKYYNQEGFLSSEYETLAEDIKSGKAAQKEKETAAKALEGEIKALTTELGALKTDRAAATKLLKESSDLERKLEKLTAEIKAARQHREFKEERQAINESIASNNDSMEALRAQLADFNDNLSGYDEDTVQTINHLIQHLELGHACPVCDQTVLTMPEKGILSDEDRLALNDINEKIENFEETNQKHVMRIDVIDELLKDKESQDETELDEKYKALEAEKSQTDQLLKQANNELEKKEQLSTLLTEKNNEIHSLNMENQKERHRLQGLTAKKDEFNYVTGFNNYDDFKRFMAEEKVYIADFQKSLNQLKESVNGLSRQAEVSKSSVEKLTADYKKTSSNMTAFKQSVGNFIKRHHFNDANELYSIINDDSIEGKREEISAFDQENTALKTKIEDVKNSLESTETINVEADIKEVETVKQSLETAREYFAAVKERKNQNIQSREYLSELIDTFNESFEEFNQLNELVDAVQGKKGQKVSLERYVLTYYLERILELANVRLTAMTNHRYKLQRSMKKVNRYSGLDIEVFDYYNNQARNINSLSGGETFQASLVLALALNEALQHESGGITLDTMLIDEGFGTLDHETLEVAISTLIDLQTTGKTIGIISHVEELKERMEHILYVTPDNERSTTEVVTL